MQSVKVHILKYLSNYWVDSIIFQPWHSMNITTLNGIPYSPNVISLEGLADPCGKRSEAEGALGLATFSKGSRFEVVSGVEFGLRARTLAQDRHRFTRQVELHQTH